MKKSVVGFVVLGHFFITLYADDMKRSPRAPRAEKHKEAAKPVDAANAPGNTVESGDADHKTVTSEDVLEFLRVSLGADRSHRSHTTYVYSSDIGAEGYVITKPGTYIVQETLYSNADKGAAISIQANNVVLDFNYCSLYQVADASVDGIHITKDAHNIEVKNGMVYELNGTGIIMDSGVYDSVITNMAIRNCAGDGIVYQGDLHTTSYGVKVVRSEISGNKGIGARFSYVDQVKISHSLFNNNYLHGVVMEHGRNHEIYANNFCNNHGDSVVSGLSLFSVHSSTISSCVANANRAREEAVGFMVDGHNNKVENCEASANDAALARGFDVTGMRHNIVRCDANGNGSQSHGVGFVLQETTRKCCVQYCSSTVNADIGFKSVAAYGVNMFRGNFSFGHGRDGNYVGAGIGSIVVGVAAQRTALEESGNNISVV